MLLDSNIIIYPDQPGYDWLREFIAEHDPVVSALSYVETLGYHRLTAVEQQFLEEFFTVWASARRCSEFYCDCTLVGNGRKTLV